MEITDEVKTQTSTQYQSIKTVKTQGKTVVSSNLNPEAKVFIPTFLTNLTMDKELVVHAQTAQELTIENRNALNLHKNVNQLAQIPTNAATKPINGVELITHNMQNSTISLQSSQRTIPKVEYIATNSGILMSKTTIENSLESVKSLTKLTSEQQRSSCNNATATATATATQTKAVAIGTKTNNSTATNLNNSIKLKLKIDKLKPKLQLLTASKSKETKTFSTTPIKLDATTQLAKKSRIPILKHELLNTKHLSTTDDEAHISTFTNLNKKSASSTMLNSNNSVQRAAGGQNSLRCIAKNVIQSMTSTKDKIINESKVNKQETHDKLFKINSIDAKASMSTLTATNSIKLCDNVSSDFPKQSQSNTSTTTSSNELNHVTSAIEVYKKADYVYLSTDTSQISYQSSKTKDDTSVIYDEVQTDSADSSTDRCSAKTYTIENKHHSGEPVLKTSDIINNELALKHINLGEVEISDKLHAHENTKILAKTQLQEYQQPQQMAQVENKPKVCGWYEEINTRTISYVVGEPTLKATIIDKPIISEVAKIVEFKKSQEDVQAATADSLQNIQVYNNRSEATISGQWSVAEISRDFDIHIIKDISDINVSITEEDVDSEPSCGLLQTIPSEYSSKESKEEIAEKLKYIPLKKKISLPKTFMSFKEFMEQRYMQKQQAESTIKQQQATQAKTPIQQPTLPKVCGLETQKCTEQEAKVCDLQPKTETKIVVHQTETEQIQKQVEVPQNEVAEEGKVKEKAIQIIHFNQITIEDSQSAISINAFSKVLKNPKPSDPDQDWYLESQESILDLTKNNSHFEILEQFVNQALSEKSVFYEILPVCEILKPQHVQYTTEEFGNAILKEQKTENEQTKTEQQTADVQQIHNKFVVTCQNVVEPSEEHDTIDKVQLMKEEAYNVAVKHANVTTDSITVREIDNEDNIIINKLSNSQTYVRINPKRIIYSKAPPTTPTEDFELLPVFEIQTTARKVNKKKLSEPNTPKKTSNKTILTTLSSGVTKPTKTKTNELKSPAKRTVVAEKSTITKLTTKSTKSTNKNITTRTTGAALTTNKTATATATATSTSTSTAKATAKNSTKTTNTKTITTTAANKLKSSRLTTPRRTTKSIDKTSTPMPKTTISRTRLLRTSKPIQTTNLLNQRKNNTNGLTESLQNIPTASKVTEKHTLSHSSDCTPKQSVGFINSLTSKNGERGTFRRNSRATTPKISPRNSNTFSAKSSFDKSARSNLNNKTKMQMQSGLRSGSSSSRPLTPIPSTKSHESVSKEPRSTVASTLRKNEMQRRRSLFPNDEQNDNLDIEYSSYIFK